MPVEVQFHKGPGDGRARDIALRLVTAFVEPGRELRNAVVVEVLTEDLQGPSGPFDLAGDVLYQLSRVAAIAAHMAAEWGQLDVNELLHAVALQMIEDDGDGAVAT